MVLCPCCSDICYEDCCAPFHKGAAIPSSPVLLMRSRYSAYALNIPKYIVKTTHRKNPSFSKDTPLWLKQISEFSLSTRFEKLEILKAEETFQKGLVVFKAYLFQGSQNVSFQEESYFLKVQEKWFYLSGVVTKF